MVLAYGLNFSIGMMNYYYYQNYGTYFDVFLFSFKDAGTENSKAILSFIWNHFPIFQTIIIVLILTFSAAFLLKKVLAYFHKKIKKDGEMEKKPMVWKSWSAVSLVATALIFLCVNIMAYIPFVRGSVSRFPLRRMGSIVSDYAPLNYAVPQATIALYWAVKDYMKSNVISPIPKEKLEEISQYFVCDKAKKGFTETFIQKTPEDKFLDREPPQVVFGLIESLSSHLMNFDQPQKNDMLGAFRKHKENNFFWKRFLPYSNGTYPSLHRLLYSSNYTYFNISTHRNKSFYTSIARPYKEKGYKTYFITSAYYGWERLNFVLPQQYFDEVIGAEKIIKKYTSGELHDWGVPDEYSYRYIEDEILSPAKKNNEKVFVFLLTISSHAPFDVSSQYVPKPVEAVPEMEGILDHHKESYKNKILISSQYSLNLMGLFLDSVKEKYKNVIVSFTGDHNLRALAYKKTSWEVLKRSVPFFIYLPPKYKQYFEKKSSWQYNKEEIGSHRDVFPTLYNISLSNSSYFSLGKNMLSINKGPLCHFAYNEKLILLEEGAIVRMGADSRIFPWKNAQSLEIQTQSKMYTGKNWFRMRELLDAITRWQLFSKESIHNSNQ